VVFFVALFNTLRRKKSNRTSTNSIGTSYIQQDIFTNSVKNTPLKYQFCAFSIKATKKTTNKVANNSA
jgi:hypothetical protein